MAQASGNIQDELAHRHRSAAMVFGGLILLSLVLAAAAYALAGKDLIYRPGSPVLIMALRIAIVLFALGAFVFRRTQFAAMRLQDIASLRGISGLLTTLQRTTTRVAWLGGAIALMGFIMTMMTDDPSEMLRAGGVAIIVLLYCYPRRSAWQRVVQGIERAGLAKQSPAEGRIA